MGGHGGVIRGRHGREPSSPLGVEVDGETSEGTRRADTVQHGEKLTADELQEAIPITN